MVLFVCSRSQSRYDEVLESNSGLGLTVLFTLTMQKSRRFSVVMTKPFIFWKIPRHLDTLSKPWLGVEGRGTAYFFMVTTELKQQDKPISYF